jgi:predicted  nucleic acid-binding Zn-ribbon protein
MAERRTAKAASSKRGSTAVAGSDTLTTVMAERDRLRAELDVARRRIAELEAMHAEAVDRIDWAIDSLHSLVESSA